jgi:predicted N-acetyltransferase YhbS
MATRTESPVASSSPLVPASRKAAARLAARPAPPTPLSPLRLRLAAARAGDQPSIHAFLLSVFQGPTAAEFHAQVEEPGYLPADRLVVKHGEDIVAHLRLARQTIQVGQATLPAARFMDLATAPQLRSRGLATALLAAGERATAERGVLVGIARTRVPSLFARKGWSACGGQTWSSASPRAVLAELSATGAARLARETASSLFQPVATPLSVRPLRRIELPAIVRLYEQQSCAHTGWPVRSAAYWEWLLARGACDRIYVASTAAESGSFSELIDSIVGYACIRQSRIVELVAAAGQSLVGEQLLERVCADAREQDGWSIRFDSPADDPLHELLVRAGGELTGEAQAASEVSMLKVFDPLGVLRALAGEFHARFLSSGVSVPGELGVDLRAGEVAGSRRSSGVVERYRVRISKQAAIVSTGGPSRHSIGLALADLPRLVLGDVDPAGLVKAGRLIASTPKSLALAAALFGKSAWWRPILDDLLA